MWIFNMVWWWGGWWGKDYSAMRWPCPMWFHVPLYSEFLFLDNILTTFSIRTTAWLVSYLKMTYTYWFLNTSNWTLNTNNTIYYMCDSWYQYILSKYWFITWFFSNRRVDWWLIRPFYNWVEKPDNSRTKLYDWSSVATGAWIFWNSTLWLISASSDWINWITIADKNLWATTVYNSWASQTISNCWYWFQYWNNYNFQTWNITTSGTQVDASNYWPNYMYYCSNVFITNSWSNWSSVKNDNLRWGEIWVIW